MCFKFSYFSILKDKKLKAVDSEQKTSKIEFSITSIFSNLVVAEDKFTIDTSSYIINYFKLQSLKNLKNLDFQDGSSFKLPSFCNLIQNCFLNQLITLKVIEKIKF